jgi:hypothetical protein
MGPLTAGQIRPGMARPQEVSEAADTVKPWARDPRGPRRGSTTPCPGASSPIVDERAEIGWTERPENAGAFA